MKMVIKDLKNANQRTKEALKSINNASDRIQGKFQYINNTFTGDNITIEKLGEAMQCKMKEAGLLKVVIKHLEKIIEVNDAQIKLMFDTLADNKSKIESLEAKIKALEKKE